MQEPLQTGENRQETGRNDTAQAGNVECSTSGPKKAQRRTTKSEIVRECFAEGMTDVEAIAAVAQCNVSHVRAIRSRKYMTRKPDRTEERLRNLEAAVQSLQTQISYLTLDRQEDPLYRSLQAGKDKKH